MTFFFLLAGKGRDVGEDLVKSLQKTKYSVDEKLGKTFINLFGKKTSTASSERKLEEESSEEYSQSGDEAEDDDDEMDVESSDSKMKQKTEIHDGRLRRKAIFKDEVGESDEAEDDSASDSQDLDEDDVQEAEDKVLGNISRWKEPLKEKGRKKNPNLMQMVYGAQGSSATTGLINETNATSDDDEEESDAEDFFKPKGEGNKVCHFKDHSKLW